MRLKKKHSRFLAFAIVGVVILLTILMGVRKEIKASMPSIEIMKDSDGNIEASVVFGEFRKSEVKDGHKNWEIYAKVGRFFPQSGKAILDSPVVTLFKPEDTVVMTSDKGVIFLHGNSLNNVEAHGHVVVTSEKKATVMHSDDLFYEHDTDKLTVPGPVIIESPQMKLTGIGMTGNTALKKFFLNDSVATTLQSKSPKKGTNKK